MDGFFEQLLNDFVLDRLAHVYEADDEYNELLEKEKIIYGNLECGLTAEQIEKLTDYLVAINSTSSRKEMLMYRQGIKDCISFIKYFLK